MSLRHRFEADMLPAVAATRGHLIGPKRREADTNVFAEVASASGVADLVIAKFRGDALEARNRSCYGPLLDPLAVQTVHQLTTAPSTARDIASDMAVSLDHLRSRVLPQLRSQGWVDRHRCGRWELVAPAGPLLEWAVAVEAKRRDWRSGAYQARRYRRFANRSFLAIDAVHATIPLRYAADLAATGVGLLTVDAAAPAATCHQRLRWAQPQRSWEQRLMGERLWQMVLTDRCVGDSGHVFGKELPRPALVS